jgi:hypothetical protein
MTSSISDFWVLQNNLQNRQVYRPPPVEKFKRDLNMCLNWKKNVHIGDMVSRCLNVFIAIKTMQIEEMIQGSCRV